MNSGPIPTSEEASRARTSGRGRSGSMTSRLGSSVSSPLGKNSGMNVQPSARIAANRTTTVPACAFPCSTARPSIAKQATTSANASEPK